MKKLLQINPVIRTSTSTGRIMQEIGELAIANGWESYLAYSGGRDGLPKCKSHLLPVGNRLDVVCHAIETRLFDRHGLASRKATKKIIREISKIQPDVIHIHNIHGYFLNYKLLFEFLKEYGRPVIWTVHDCWLFTGHCYHYSSVHCYRWKERCHHCPQKKAFPASWFRDRSRKNYLDKKLAFNSLPKDKFLIVPVSEWMMSEMQASMLGSCRMKVIHNGIDTQTFAPRQNTEEIRQKYGLASKHVIMAIASIWLPEKGIKDLFELSTLLHDNECIVMVGVDKKLQQQLPSNIIGIQRTADVNELAELYSYATVVVNPTWQDNYPTVNLEAIACGTPVVTYRTGGSPESITEDTGFIVEQGDVKGIIEAVRTIERKGKDFYSIACRTYAEKHFSKKMRYMDYIKLYDELSK